MKRYRFFYPVVLLVSDFVVIVASFVLAFIIRAHTDLSSHPYTSRINAHTYIKILIIATIAWLLIFASLGLYNQLVYRKRSREWSRLLMGCFYGVLFLIGCDFVLDHRLFPARLIAVYGFILAFGLLLCERIALRTIKSILFRFDVGITRVLIIGSSKVTDEVVANLNNTADSGHKIVALVGRLRRQPAGIRRFHNVAQALEHLHSLSVDCIIQTELYSDPALNSLIMTVAQANHIQYKFVPANDEFFTANNQLELIGNLPIVAVQQTRLLSWGQVEKRLFDIFMSIIGLIITSPLFILTAIVIKALEPKYRVIFKQKRITRFGEERVIYKFRTMRGIYSGQDIRKVFKKLYRDDLIKRLDSGETQFENDPRVRRFGRFMRKTSLDELPQLWNVLKGDISLVGPRAIVKSELANYQKLAPLRQTVRSGITGLAQVSGRGELPFEQRLELDIYYVQNWSFWLDIVIIVRTIASILSRNGVG